MEMAKRLMQTMSASLREEPAKKDRTVKISTDMEDSEWYLEIPAAAYRWRRLTLMLKIVAMHASMGSIITHLEDQRRRLADEAYAAYQHVALKPMAEKASKKIPSEPMAKGKALSRSGAGPFESEPTQCAHPAERMSHPRGGAGGSKWITCLKCGSRWERIVWSEVPVEQSSATSSQAPETTTKRSRSEMPQ